MNNLKTIAGIISLGILLLGCERETDDTSPPVVLDAGTLSGGPFTFAVDGVPDMVSEITLDDTNLNGSIQGYVITDDSKNILGLPPTLEAVEGVDFDGAGVGSCYIYHLTYEEGLSGLATGENLDGLVGDFDLSNFIIVNRNALSAGILSGGPFSFTVDGVPDMVSGITLDDSSLNGETQTYVITDDAKNILGLPPTLEAVEGVDFDTAGPGSCYIYHLTYSGELNGLEGGENLEGLMGNFNLSNFIMVNRDALNAGVLSGGPYEFVVDGIPDMVSEIALDDTALNGDMQTYVITDDAKNILGIPSTLDAVKGVDFDGAGVGSCYIYHLTYSTGLEGLETGANLEGLTGSFGLSNFVVVNRNALNAGTLVGGPYEFVVDGIPDMVMNISLDDTELSGDKQTYVITDDSKNILGIPPTLDAVKGVDFDGAGAGSCYIYHLTYSTDLNGLEAGGNLEGLTGSFGLSNFIVVNRNPLNAGSLVGGPYNFVVDGIPDMVSNISLDSSELNGDKQTYVITDDSRNILGIPPTLEDVMGVDFDGAGEGSCYIYHLTYSTDVIGLEAGNNLSGLTGEFDLSNFIMVNRNGLNAGTLAGGPYNFVVDGIPDMVMNIVLDDSELNGDMQTYVITDDSKNILGIPPTLDAVKGVDFDGAGVGSCYIYHLTYSAGLNGLEAGNNLESLTGNFGLSNFIVVNRRAALNAGTLSGGPYDFMIDGIPDMVSGVVLNDMELTGSNQTYVITDDAGNILGLPPTIAAVEGVDFDAAGVGVCYIWHLTYEDGLQGLETGKNAADLEGDFDLSNFLTVTRHEH
ncbi:hypothetical protein [Croceitalea sp. P059]|uniref:hypothetical protein n=1 Tax=Croceitalea sp. P059 TaxID=3075601 RepID=UPI0028887E54|nr:hypothetical protein [Croceitalea sp. P059]MDT0539305.1 hypothetical protein [Croceitalea sp. P059]